MYNQERTTCIGMNSPLNLKEKLDRLIGIETLIDTTVAHSTLAGGTLRYKIKFQIRSGEGSVKRINLITEACPELKAKISANSISSFGTISAGHHYRLMFQVGNATLGQDDITHISQGQLIGLKEIKMLKTLYRAG